MDNSDKGKKTNFFKLKLIIFSIAIIIFILISNAIVKYNENEVYNEISNAELLSLNNINSFAENRLSYVSNDIYFLRDVYEEYKNNKTLKFDDLEIISKKFANNRIYYDEFSVIDSKGKETIKLNNYSRPEIIVDETLRDFSNESWFLEFLNTKNDLYISQISLSVEKRMVEMPYRPIIKFYIKVYKDQNVDEIISVTYNLNEIIRRIAKESQNEFGYMEFLDKKGNYIYSIKRSNEFGFLFEDKDNISLEKNNKSLWDKIVFDGGNGRYISQNRDLYVYKKIRSRNFDYNLYLLYTNKKELIKDKVYEISKFYILTVVITIFIVSILIFYALKEYLLRKIYNNKLKDLALYDTLTKIPNREHFNREIEKKIEEERSFSLLFLDLDGFKAINDTFGHHIGDEVLKIVSKKLVNTVKNKDFVSRMGGDEFTILITETKIEDIKKICLRIIKNISENMDIEEKNCKVGISIGVSRYPNDSEDIDEIIRIADDMMYLVKSKGKNDFKIYE